MNRYEIITGQQPPIEKPENLEMDNLKLRRQLGRYGRNLFYRPKGISLTMNEENNVLRLQLKELDADSAGYATAADIS